MAPHINFEEFNKKIEPLPVYFDYEKPVVITYFFNNVDGLIYELTELRALPGTEYSGCIEIKCCIFNEMAQDSATYVAEEILENSNDPFLAAQEALNVGLDIEEKEFAAIYLFKDIVIKNNGNDVVGKQIKAARISDDYAEFGVTKRIYSYIAKKYSVLVCDNTQTPNGHSLWAYGISKWGELKIYNVMTQKFVGVFNREEESPDIKPWSVPFNYPMQDENKFRKNVCEITDLTYYHLVLVLVATEVNFEA